MKYAAASLFALLISLSSFLPTEASGQAGSQKGKDYFLIDSIQYDSLPAGDKAVLDSLLPLYHKATHDTTRFSLLVSLCETVNTESVWPRYNDLLFQRAGALLKNPGSLSEKELRSVKKSYAMSLQNKGYYEENFSGDLAASLDYYSRCQKIQEEIGDKKNLAMTLNNIGITYHSQGNINKSLEYYMKSVKMQEALNDRQGLAYSLNNIASVYLEQGDTAKALEYQERTIRLREETGDKHGLAISLSNIAAIYLRTGESEKAMGYFNRCVKLWEALGEKQGLAYCMRYLGVIYERKAAQLEREGKPVPDSLLARAEEYTLGSLRLYESIGDKRGASLILVIIGEHYLHKKNITKALEYGLRGMAISKEIGYPANIRNASSLLYSIYKEQGKWKEALAMHELSIQMRDSLFNADTKKSTLQKQMKYEYEKQEVLKDAAHQKELAVAEEGKKRQQIVSIAVGAGLLMMALFAIFIFNRLRVTRKQKEIIEDQKKIVDQKNKHITDSINYAKRIQDSILPSHEELTKCFSDHFIFFRPRDIVSGDFYWVSARNDVVILAIADCTGHGVPGAFMSMIGNTLLNEIVNEQRITGPAEILNHLHEGIGHALHQDSRMQDDGMDISVCLFDKKQNRIVFAGANHSLYVADEHAIREIKGDIYSIGSMFGQKQVSFTQKEAALTPGSALFFSTDGLPDQVGGPERKKFMTSRLQELFRLIAPLPSAEQAETVRKKFEEWKAARPQMDDILVAGVRL